MKMEGSDSYLTSDLLIYFVDIKNDYRLAHHGRGSVLELVYINMVICLAQHTICAWRYETPSGKGCEGDDQGRCKQSAMPSQLDQVKRDSSGVKRRIVVQRIETRPGGIEFGHERQSFSVRHALSWEPLARVTYKVGAADKKLHHTIRSRRFCTVHYSCRRSCVEGCGWRTTTRLEVGKLSGSRHARPRRCLRETKYAYEMIPNRLTWCIGAEKSTDRLCLQHLLDCLLHLLRLHALAF
jgi:hypothetical protein